MLILLALLALAAPVEVRVGPAPGQVTRTTPPDYPALGGPLGTLPWRGGQIAWDVEFVRRWPPGGQDWLPVWQTFGDERILDVLAVDDNTVLVLPRSPRRGQGQPTMLSGPTLRTQAPVPDLPLVDALAVALPDRRVLIASQDGRGPTPSLVVSQVDLKTRRVRELARRDRLRATAWSQVSDGAVLLRLEGDDPPALEVQVATGSVRDVAAPPPSTTAVVKGNVAHRAGVALLTLDDERELLVGGQLQGRCHGQVLLYDSETNHTASLASVTPRSGALLVALPDRRVLVVGGSCNGKPVLDAEIVGLDRGFVTSSGRSDHPHLGGIIHRLDDGRVMVAGGADLSFSPTRQVELWQEGTWTSLPELPRGVTLMRIGPDGTLYDHQGPLRRPPLPPLATPPEQ